MHPHVRACLAIAALAAFGGAPSRPLTRVVHSTAQEQPAQPASADEHAFAALCPTGSLPDGDQCVRFVDARGSEAEPLEEQRSARRDRGGSRESYDLIPRRPDRPSSYDTFVYPIPMGDAASLVLSGGERTLPDDHQRASLKATGHGGVDLAAERGTEVRALSLEHQEGDAEVLFVGQLFGNTVVTRHTLREAGRLREYLVLHGHLDAAAPSLVSGAKVHEGEVLGYVGDSGSEGLVHLHIEVRRVRDGIEGAKLTPPKLTANSHTVAVDPRNVLPLKR